MDRSMSLCVEGLEKEILSSIWILLCVVNLSWGEVKGEGANSYHDTCFDLAQGSHQMGFFELSYADSNDNLHLVMSTI